MKTKTLLIFGSSLVLLVLLIGGVVYLRLRNAPTQDLGTLTQSSPSTDGVNPTTQTKPSAQSSGAANRKNRSPADQVKADAVANSAKTLPSDIRTTWTPEFAAQQAAITK